MKIQTILFLFLFLCAAELAGQSILPDSVNRIKWLKANAIKVSSIDPAKTDFSDLEKLKSWIGDAQVVSIGEPDHQIGSVILAKTRLIEFLHERMGFDLLTSENGMFEVAKTWKHIRSGISPYDAYIKNLFFANYREYLPLFNYINSKAQSSRPLEIAGFDPQFMGLFTRDSLLPDLRKFFTEIGYSNPQLEDNSEFAKEFLLVRDEKSNNANFALKEISKLSRILDSLSAAPLSWDARFYKQFLQSTKKRIEWILLEEPKKLMTGSVLKCIDALQTTLRDEQMAENMLWYLKQNPGRKIIVLAHNTHLIKDYPGNKDKQRWNDDPNAPPLSKGLCEETYMGYVLADSLKEKLFNISFTIGEGNLGYVNLKDSAKNFTWYIPKSKREGVLENYLDAAAMENAIVNLKRPGEGGEWLKDFIRIRYYTGPGAKNQWSKAADAIFYVRKATPLHLE